MAGGNYVIGEDNQDAQAIDNKYSFGIVGRGSEKIEEKKDQETAKSGLSKKGEETNDKPGEEAVKSGESLEGGKEVLDGGEVKQVEKTTQERGEVDSLPIEFVFQKKMVEKDIDSQGTKGKHGKGPEIAED